MIMDAETIKTFGQVAGIGGLGLVAVIMDIFSRHHCKIDLSGP